jgi:hypothetical protein
MASLSGYESQYGNLEMVDSGSQEAAPPGASHAVEYDAPGYEPDPYGFARRPDEVSPDLRPFPNEDLGFWIKPIDNSRRVRQEDPGLAEACWRFFSATALVVVVVVGLLAPSAYGVLNGFRLQRLKDENIQLEAQKRSLELKKSRLLSPVRLEALAEKYDFVDPPRDRVLRLRGSENEATAAWRVLERGAAESR